MERLADVIPKLDSGLTPKDLLEEQYLAGEPIEDDKAAEMVANMNQLLQQEIDRLSNENAQMDEQLAAVEAAGIGSFSIASGVTELVSDEVLPEIELPEDLFAEPEEEASPLAEPEINTDIQPEDMESEVMQELETEEVQEPAAMSLEEVAQPVAETVAETEPDIESAILAETVKQMTEEAPEEQSLPKINLSEVVSTSKLEKVLPKIAEPETLETPGAINKLSKEQRTIFTYFVSIKGMEKQLCQAMTGAAEHLRKGTSAKSGNMIIQGGKGSGKTVLATSMIKALQKETGKPNGKIGKIAASTLNQKNVGELLEKVAGGCLIIEQVGDISRETAVKLSLWLESDHSGVMIIIEDTKHGVEKALAKDSGFAAKFSEKINIPIFTSDELVVFAKAYANELGYTIDEMGILALYNCISNIQKVDRATTLTEVKEIVDDAIAHAEKGVFKKAFSIITSRRYDEEDYIILHEKDFDLK